MSIKNIVKKIITHIKRKEIVPVVIRQEGESLLLNKHAIITGGSGDIGCAIAKEFLVAGASVTITGTNKNKLLKNIELLKDFGDVDFEIVDVANVADINRCVGDIISKHRIIDILVNCAGKNGESVFLDVSEREWDIIIDVNLKGTYFFSQSVAKHMINNNIKGHILNVSSASSVRPASMPYAISKWGVRGLTIGLADELIGSGIVVNAIGPGPVATNMNNMSGSSVLTHQTNPAGRYARPEEIANIVCFMVSGAADLVVGDTLFCSGGGGITSLHG